MPSLGMLASHQGPPTRFLGWHVFGLFGHCLFILVLTLTFGLKFKL